MYGRFLSPDPARDQHFEETPSWNIYSYVQNNPSMAIDPNGMEHYWVVVNSLRYSRVLPKPYMVRHPRDAPD